MHSDNPRRALPPGIYGITAEKYSRGRTNVEVAAAMIAGGIAVLQYREKRPAKSHAAMLDECRQIRELTREAGIPFIVNDHVDLALLVDADGVHVGQDDLPVAEVRRLLGPDRIIGLSTHNPSQAAAAVEAGADYIGVGPIFATATKEDVCAPVGLTYLDHIVRSCPLPFVAIGGIKEHNLAEVAAHGARTVCLVTAIVEADDIAATIRGLRAILEQAGHPVNSH
ncbi:thiamine phosphate synthase [Desulfoprunum benzoelyticum]|uniref:Thiamine-phosphate synthase n=1 Tax=Desulfoprunum benzoelyticum TaxID=1506996 RepID=A0A840UW47_9BACT|nr:thiamine phosphate synthase [Desulfoprunum benzoelyticum]MBB5349093.1 thiamine-phosphate pyrophosphorylase [Desulfoprunum benzoelyticum]MBM9530668.1 thiamine phosphate synthase [Desulfoprunum benzoelyticum]